ncbi:MAG: PQQ-like beta-propeller repeat protein [Phycisphaerae bacterium]|nr:PQQ-like beta-propeller repeat protein [Phycisphaerae bacterium]
MARCILPMVTVAYMLAACPPVNADQKTKQPYWPEFRGPRRDSISTETGLLKKWPQEGPRLIWKYSDCGKGFSGVSIAEGKIFSAGDFGKREMLFALGLDGKLLWKSPNGRSWRGASPAGSRTTPTYVDGVLYHMNPNGRVAAYHAKDGKEIWAVELKKRFDAKFGLWSLAENLIVDGDKVLCLPGGKKALAAALDKKTGKTVWTTTGLTDPAAYCTPVVATHKGVRQMITMTAKSVICVDVTTGKLLWTYPYKMGFPQHATPPVFHDGHVFVACGHFTGGTLLRINPDSSGVTRVWHMRKFDNCHGGVILLNGRLYGSGCRVAGKGFYCVDFLTGKTIGTNDVVGKISIIYADGMLYGLNHKGPMYLMEVTADGVKVVSRFDMPGKRKVNIYLAHPVICAGRLYLREGNNLYAHDIRAD